MDPIASLVPPTDIPELRRVLGLYVVSRRYIQDYAMITAPMTSILRGRNPEFFGAPPNKLPLTLPCARTTAWGDSFGHTGL